MVRGAGILDNKKGPKPKASSKEIEEALSQNFGNISAVARVLSKEKNIKLSRQAVWERTQKNKQLQKVVADCREKKLDFIEAKFMEAVKNGDITAIIFGLKCLGKSRGYVERQSVEHSGPDGKPIEFQQVQVYLPEKEGLE